MVRKKTTQLFPFLAPIRRAQRNLCFYTGMYFDSNRYAKTKTDKLLPCCVYKSNTNLLNENTGFDIKYQGNRLFNLHLAAKKINGILIRPEDTFSFWQLARMADKEIRYKDGLSVENGSLTIVKGGGLCHLSNFLFRMFLHTPLTIIERHPHRVKDYPSPNENEPESVDATVSEGWLDLKIKNQTGLTFQIDLYFEGPCLFGRILTDQAMPYRYEILNRDKLFFKRDGKVYEQVSVYRQCKDYQSGVIHPEKLLYTDTFEIGYSMPEITEFALQE